MVVPLQPAVYWAPSKVKAHCSQTDLEGDLVEHIKSYRRFNYVSPGTPGLMSGAIGSQPNCIVHDTITIVRLQVSGAWCPQCGLGSPVWAEQLTALAAQPCMSALNPA